MSCLFQSTTQKEELPWFVLEDSAQHNTVSILPRSSDDTPRRLLLDAFIAFQTFFLDFLSFPQHTHQKKEVLEPCHWNKWHDCPRALWLAVLRLKTFQRSEDNWEQWWGGFFFFFFFFWPLWHLIPFHSAMLPRQNNHLMGVESDYHCSLLSPMSAENIVQRQQQLLASVMPGQVRGRRGGDTATRGDGGKKKAEAKGVVWGVCVCVCVCVMYKRCTHCKSIRMDK